MADKNQLAEMERIRERAMRKEKRRETVTLDQFRAAVRWGVIKTIRLRAEGNEFVVDAETKDGKRMPMAMARGGQERRFQSVVAALRAVKELGLEQVMVDVTHWSHHTRDPWMLKRPDMSERLKVGHAMTRETVMEVMTKPGNDKRAILQQLIQLAEAK